MKTEVTLSILATFKLCITLKPILKILSSQISLCTNIIYLWFLRTIENSFGYRIEKYKNYFRNRSSTDEYSEHINLQEDLVLFKLRHLGSRIFLVWLAKLFETGIHFWLVNVWPEHQKFSWIRAAGTYGDMGTLPFIFSRLVNPILISGWRQIFPTNLPIWVCHICANWPRAKDATALRRAFCTL